jgi:hypothetical protein
MGASGDEEYAALLAQILELVKENKTPDALFSLLGRILKLVTTKSVSQAVLIANANLEVLDRVLSGVDNVELGTSLQLILVDLYCNILIPSEGTHGAPGYVARTVVGNLISTMGNKLSTPSSKEVSVALLGCLIARRPDDMGSMLNEVISAVLKLVKDTDTMQRILSLKALSQIVGGCGERIGDLHPEIVKQATKIVSDRNADVRQGIADLMLEVSRNSAGCSTVSTELMLGACTRGLEDDIGAVSKIPYNSYIGECW